MPQGTGGTGPVRDRQQHRPEALRPGGFHRFSPLDACGVPYRDEADGFVYVG